MADDQSKTEDATPERRKRAREQGQFARARDAGGIAATVAVLIVLAATTGALFDRIREFAMRCFGEPFDLLRGAEGDLAARLMKTLGWSIFPCALAAMVAAIAIGFVEAGWHPQLDLVMPKWSRMDPIGKLGQMLSFKHILTELTFSSLRVGIVGYVAYSTINEAFPVLVRYTSTGIVSASEGLLAIVARLAVRTCLVLVVLALADYAQSYFKTEKEMKMSKQEIKEEFKQQEGDPKIKHKMRALARERIRRGVAKQVAQADVIVTNPTHVSVALRYRPDEGAPVVVAKGYDEIALYIRELAQENGVFIMRVPPLARALAQRVRVGKRVPVDTYGAVAEVLAFVYRLRAEGRAPRKKPKKKQAA